MNGWTSVLLLVAATLGLLWLLQLRGAMLALAAATLLFGACGYALQGRPTYPGVSRTAADDATSLPLADARHAFFGTFTPAERWLIMADSYGATGDTQGAVQTVQSAIRAHPGDPELWVGLGNAFVDHAHGLSPAAQFAFARAVQLAPSSPGPRFFLGLARMRSGDRAGALIEWRRVLAVAPAKAGWRPMVERGVSSLSGTGD